MDDQTLPLVAGTTFDFDLTWETENEQGELEPIDITGCSIELQIRTTSTKSLLLRCSLADGAIFVADPTTGKMDIHIDPDKTVDHDVADWQSARWEVRVTFPSGDAYSLVRGWATLAAGVVHYE